MKKLALIILITALVVGLFLYVQKNKSLSPHLPATVQPFVQMSDSNPVLKIAFMDIGQGDATFITFPNGQKMLIDCARDAVVLSALSRNMSWIDRDIDYVLVTHPDADHYGGCIDVLKRYHVKHIYFNGFEKEGSQLLKQFHETVDEKIASDGAEFIIVTSTRTLMIASTTIQFLYPDHDLVRDPHVPGVKEVESNNTSIVLKISYGAEDVLLTGDMETPLEHYLVEKYGSELQAEILKVGHHGSKSSSSEEFLHVVQPVHSIISAGTQNAYGHPSLRTLKHLERVNTEILRTDHIGDILATITTSTIFISHAFETTP